MKGRYSETYISFIDCVIYLNRSNSDKNMIDISFSNQVEKIYKIHIINCKEKKKNISSIYLKFSML